MPGRSAASVFYEDLGRSLNRGGLPAVLERIDALIKERRPGIGGDRLLPRPARIRRRGGVPPLPARPRRPGQRVPGLPLLGRGVHRRRHVVGAGVRRGRLGDRLGLGDAAATAPSRAIEVLKLRGSDFLSGRHAYRLGADGIDVFPRLADLDGDDYAATAGAGFVGHPRLGRPAHRRLPRRVQHPDRRAVGLGQDAHGAAFPLQRRRARASRGSSPRCRRTPSSWSGWPNGFGWSFDEDDVEMLHASPVDLYVDEWVYSLLDRAQEIGAQRIVLDSLTDLSAAVVDPLRFREYLYSLTQRCAKRGISLMLTLELPDLYEPTYHRPRGHLPPVRQRDPAALRQALGGPQPGHDGAQSARYRASAGDAGVPDHLGRASCPPTGTPPPRQAPPAAARGSRCATPARGRRAPPAAGRRRLRVLGPFRGIDSAPGAGSSGVRAADS